MQTGRLNVRVAPEFWECNPEEDDDETNPIAGYLEMSMPAEFVEFISRLMNQGTSSSWSEWAWRPWGAEHNKLCTFARHNRRLAADS